MPHDMSVLELSPTIAHSTEAFPKLSADQVERVRAVAREVSLDAEESLWTIGQRNASFFVILEGAVDIRQKTGNGETMLIVRHGPMGFTGDIDLMSGHASIVEGVAAEPSKLLEVCPDRLKKLVVADSGISDVILAAFFARRQAQLSAGLGNVTLLGSRFSPDTFRIREFLERNSRPFRWMDLDADDGAAALLEGFGIEPHETPVVIAGDGGLHRNPSLEAMAACMGLSTVAEEDHIHDVIVVGAGPAGLAASVYAGSEGLDVITVDSVAPGGQASTSSKIENYLGFPTGISGRELAQRAQVQAEKFGVRIAAPRSALKLHCEGPIYKVDVGQNQSVSGRAVVVATGVHYRRLSVPQAEKFEGRGVYFGATSMEARLCSGDEVVIVGGGNSAGQAAVYLSGHASHVHIVIRSESLAHSMSKYLIDRIEALPNVTLHPFTEIEALNSADDERIDSITVRNNQSGEKTDFPARHAFIFIGAAPNTEWLNGCVETDEKGFVKTGRDIAATALDPDRWDGYTPFLLETSEPRIFAAGDVRSGSTKRVASAVGEGSICVQFIHQSLAR